MPPEGPSPLAQMFPLVLIFFIFYFLVIRPEKNKQKQKAERLARLAKNDQVVTIGGIHGTVVIIKDKTVVLRVDDNVRIEVDKEAIATIKEKDKA